MAKYLAEHSCRLSIFWLRQQGYLPLIGTESGEITWSRTWCVSKRIVRFVITTGRPEQSNQVRLQYVHYNSWSGRHQELDYRIALTATPCSFGGTRFWFVCPLVRLGHQCGRRVGVLYRVDKYFACRTCNRLAYASQMQGGRSRSSSVTIPDMDDLAKQIHRYYYRGKPTRKYRRLIRMTQRIEREFALISKALKTTFRP